MDIYYKSPNWKIFREGTKILISGGQDEVYFLDEIEDDFGENFINLINQDIIHGEIIDSQFPGISKKFLNTGIFYTDDRKKKLTSSKLEVGIIWCGKEDEFLSRQLCTELQKNGLTYQKSGIPDIQIYIRTNALLKDCIDASYKETANIPHIFVDLANAHTISIGPYVKNCYTSCIGCLIGKIQYHWGDIQIPSEPRVLSNTNLIVSWIMQFVTGFSNLGSCPLLVNNVISWNTDTMTINHDSIYRLPWCPFCGYESEGNINNQYGKGSFEIPWNF